MQENDDIFAGQTIPPAEATQMLLNELAEGQQMPIYSEKAKSEFLIGPIVKEMKRVHFNTLSIWLVSQFDFQNSTLKHLLKLKKIKMEAITVFTDNQEQSRILKAFLEALKFRFVTKETTLEEMEAELLPGQRKVWDGLKTAILDMKSGAPETTSWEDFKKELAHENSLIEAV